MKKKKITELHQATIERIREQLKKAQEELVKLRVDLEGGRLKNVHLLKEKRHDLARLKTIFKKKELETK